MTAPDHQVQRYRIVARGESPVLLAGLADGLQIETGRGWTSVVASVADESELWGLLDRFQDLAMHLVGINELGAAVMRSPAMPGGPPTGDGGGPAGGWRQWLAGAAASDPDVLAGALGPVAGNIDLSGLDIRTHALVRLAALVAAGEPRDPIRSACEAALDRGVTGAEITGVLVALLPALGTGRITAAAATVLGLLLRPGRSIPGAGLACARVGFPRRRCLPATSFASRRSRPVPVNPAGPVGRVDEPGLLVKSPHKRPETAPQIDHSGRNNRNPARRATPARSAAREGL